MNHYSYLISALAYLQIWVDSSGNKISDQSRVSELRRQMNAGASLCVPQTRISTSTHQEHHSAQMPLPGGPVQRRGIQFATKSIHNGPFLQEVLDNVFPVINGCPVQQRYRLAVRLSHIPAGLDELFHASNGSVLGGLHDIESRIVMLDGSHGWFMRNQSVSVALRFRAASGGRGTARSVIHRVGQLGSER